MLRSIVALLAASAAGVEAWNNIAYQTEDFISPKFKIRTHKGGNTAPGNLFFGMVHPETPKLNGPFIVNNEGELLWHGSTKSDGIYNFQAQNLGGTERLTWWTGFLDYTGHGYGQVHVYDKNYNQVKKICFPDSVNIVVPRPDSYPGNKKNPCFVDKHESLATNRNSILVTAYNATQTDLRKVNGPKDGWVFDCLFFELDLDTNKVLFQWSALDHVPITKSNWLGPDKSNPLFINKRQYGSKMAPWDFFHINSVQNIPGGYIVNSRMTWSLYKVNDKSGKLEWTLEGSNGGDFKMLDDIFFSWQHHPRVQHISKDGKEMNLHMFNNDNIQVLAEGKNTSSGYMLHINEKAKTVSQVYNLRDQPGNGIYSVAEGSQQELPNGHHFMGYGSQAFAQEYNGKNELIWTAQFAKREETTHSYRAYRLPWSATPKTKPKVVARATNNKENKVHVHMSWNGATEYRAWNVYTGAKPNKLKLKMKNVKKNGFETSTAFKNRKSYKYVMVEALDKQGKPMKQSKPVKIA